MFHPGIEEESLFQQYPGLRYLRSHAHAPAWYRAVGNHVLHAKGQVEMYYEMGNPETNTDLIYPPGMVILFMGR
jgi:hypothetical protein